jgi:hypothetical protein
MSAESGFFGRPPGFPVCPGLKSQGFDPSVFDLFSVPLIQPLAAFGFLGFGSQRSARRSIGRQLFEVQTDSGSERSA